MGHYSNLRISSNLDQTEEKKSNDEIYMEVKYLIPLFWLALFKLEDISALKDQYNETYYVFRATILKSCGTFKSRLNLWSKLYNDEKAEILAKLFLQYLEHIPTFSIELNINDLLGMHLDINSIDAKNEMTDLINFIDNIQINPQNHSLSNDWITPLSLLSLEIPQDRKQLDGFGETLLPCPEVDEWLKQVH